MPTPTPKQIEVLLIRVTGEVEFHSVPRGFRSLKALIDDGWLEQVGGDGENWAAFGDEEGRLKGLPENAGAFTLMRTLTPYHPVFPVGPVVFVGLEYDEENGFLEDDVPDQIRRIVGDI